MNTCQYCNKTFTTSHILGTHQRTAKYCLKLQGKSIESKYKCFNCNTKFTQKMSLDNHSKICKGVIPKIKYELEISELTFNYETKLEKMSMKIGEITIKYEEKILQLQKENDILREKASNKETAAEIYKDIATQDREVLNRIAEQPKTTKNTTNTTTIMVNTPMNFEPNRFKPTIDQFNRNDLVAGPGQYAQMIVDSYVKDDNGCMMMQTTDSSRGIHKYKDEEGQIHIDKKAAKLNKAIVAAGLTTAVNRVTVNDILPILGMEAAAQYRDKFNNNFQSELNNCISITSLDKTPVVVN